MTDIVERLRCGEFHPERGEYVPSSDGEEGANEIERLREALQYLLDMQNGPPLIGCAAEWQEAVDKARAALGEGK